MVTGWICGSARYARASTAPSCACSPTRVGARRQLARRSGVGYHRAGNQRRRCRGDRGLAWPAAGQPLRRGPPDETQTPIPVGGTLTYRLRFPDAAFTGTVRTSAKTSAWRWALYGTIVVEPADPSYWPAADRQLTLTVDDLLVEDGHIAPFRRSGPDVVAMGRYGNVMLINGDTEFADEAAVGRGRAPVRRSTPRTRGSATSPSAAPAPSWSAASERPVRTRDDSPARYLLARSDARGQSTCCSTHPGQVRLERRTPGRTYDLGAFTVTDGAAGAAAGFVRDASRRPRRLATTEAVARSATGTRTAPPDQAASRCFSLMPLLYGGDAIAGVLLRLPNGTRGRPARNQEIALVECRGEAGGGRRDLRLPDAPRGHQRRARDLP